MDKTLNKVKQVIHK